MTRTSDSGSSTTLYIRRQPSTTVTLIVERDCRSPRAGGPLRGCGKALIPHRQNVSPWLGLGRNQASESVNHLRCGSSVLTLPCLELRTAPSWTVTENNAGATRDSTVTPSAIPPSLRLLSAAGAFKF
eukprot:3215183-Rhodomonas_salina.1